MNGNYQDWDLSERLFGDVCTAQAHYYVWLRSILFSAMKTDLAYDILSIFKQSETYAMGCDFGPSTVPGFPQIWRGKKLFLYASRVQSGKPPPSPF